MSSSGLFLEEDKENSDNSKTPKRSASKKTFESERPATCCNEAATTTITWSEFEGTQSKRLAQKLPLVVACGQKVILDQSPGKRLSGLQVEGELEVKDGRSIHLITEFIFVCGKFSIGSHVRPHMSRLLIELVGQTPVRWQGKSFGNTGFVTYGGQLSIRGASCNRTIVTHLSKNLKQSQGGSNLAKGYKSVSQSSRGHWRRAASKAVDQRYGKWSVMSTKRQVNPWWQVQFAGTAASRPIGRVVITLYSRYRKFFGWGAEVGLSNKPCTSNSVFPCRGRRCERIRPKWSKCSGDIKICGRIEGAPTGDVYSVNCKGQHGTYLFVRLPGSKPRLLSISEIEIQAADTGVLTVVDEPTMWRKGDRLLVTSSSRNPWESETVEVTGVKGKQVNFKGNLKHVHSGHETGLIRSEVVQLSRNIEIRGEWACSSGKFSAKPRCGHFMIAHTNHGLVCGVEFRNLGQHTVEGRYPLHIHLPGDSPSLLVKDNSLWKNHNRGIVMHGVNRMTVEGNSCYRTNGHCFLTEDGSEQHNIIKGNIGILPSNVNWGCSSTHDGTFTCPDRSDNDVNAFWIGNPNNIFIGNVGIARNKAFRIETRHVMGIVRREFPEEAKKIGRNGKIKNSVKMGLFKDNMAHSSGFGLFNYPRMNLPNNAERGYEGFVAWRSGVGISVHNGQPLKIDGARLVQVDIGIRAGTTGARVHLSNTQFHAAHSGSLPFVMKGDRKSVV